MSGLEFILGVYETNNSNIAAEMNISRANVSMWTRKRDIPEDRMEWLSNRFKNIPKKYFQKQLTSEDKVHILKIRIEELSEE